MYAFLRRKRQWEYWHEQHMLELQQSIFQTTKDLLVRAITLISFLLYLLYRVGSWLNVMMSALFWLTFYRPRPFMKIGPDEWVELQELPPPFPIFKR